VLRETCEHLAKTLAELKTMVAGSLEWSRVHDITRQLTDTLEASRTARVATEAATDLSELSDDELIEKAARLLRMLLLAKDAKIDDPPDSFNTADQHVTPTHAVSEGEAPAPAPTPVPECPFCRRRPCVGPDSPAFEPLHWSDPSEVEKRRQAATKVMMQQVGKPLPPWYSE
jgi:hypothetical protein